MGLELADQPSIDASSIRDGVLLGARLKTSLVRVAHWWQMLVDVDSSAPTGIDWQTSRNGPGVI